MKKFFGLLGKAVLLLSVVFLIWGTNAFFNLHLNPDYCKGRSCEVVFYTGTIKIFRLGLSGGLSFSPEFSDVPLGEIRQFDTKTYVGDSFNSTLLMRDIDNEEIFLPATRNGTFLVVNHTTLTVVVILGWIALIAFVVTYREEIKKDFMTVSDFFKKIWKKLKKEKQE